MRSRDLVSRDVREVALSGDAFSYVLIRRRGRRGVGLKVDETGLTVSAPVSASVGSIEAMLRQSEPWIRRKVGEWSARQVPVTQWESGASLPFLGETLLLRVAAGPARAERRDMELQVSQREPSAEGVRRAVVAWYKREALAHLGERVAHFCELGSIRPPRFLLSSAMGRWGSCNSKREVRLAWRLVKAPPPLVDYVVAHELAHLRHMNHSGAFWLEVQRLCPGYRELRHELFATDYLYRSF